MCWLALTNRKERILKSIVILGGYGNFGKRIVENLASVYGITVCVAGRNRDRAATQGTFSFLSDTHEWTISRARLWCARILCANRRPLY